MHFFLKKSIFFALFTRNHKDAFYMTPIKRTIRFLLSKIFRGGFQRKHHSHNTFCYQSFFVVLEFYKQGLIRQMRRCHDHPLPCLEWATSLSSIKNFITTFTLNYSFGKFRWFLSLSMKVK